ncbi:hypothetical protein HOLleu_02601 [Holothuria leucospilota]|uniref:Uncharacterized protein n=1 Tax=Holothuria leucospilota TaxID=206669 RepID=A0A9Q1HLF4_HOLLE|nr:hypothetical protein HOLleu_02601 [Holothuria leucospilota]
MGIQLIHPLKLKFCMTQAQLSHCCSMGFCHYRTLLPQGQMHLFRRLSAVLFLSLSIKLI